MVSCMQEYAGSTRSFLDFSVKNIIAFKEKNKAVNFCSLLAWCWCRHYALTKPRHVTG